MGETERAKVDIAADINTTVVPLLCKFREKKMASSLYSLSDSSGLSFAFSVSQKSPLCLSRSLEVSQSL